MADDSILLKNDISVYRERLGLTQGGKYNPSLKLALKICAVLQARVEDIFWLE